MRHLIRGALLGTLAMMMLTGCGPTLWAGANQFSNAYTPTSNGQPWVVYVEADVRTGWWILSHGQPVVYAAFWYEGPGTAHDVRIRFGDHSYPPAGYPPVAYSHSGGSTTALKLSQVPTQATITWRHAAKPHREIIPRRQMTSVNPRE